METYTLTLGDVAENHVGMQKIGEECQNGIPVDTLERIYYDLHETHDVELIDLVSSSNVVSGDQNLIVPATLLVIRNGASAFNGDADLLHEEQKSLEYDSKMYNKGRVCNKKARYNICFSDESQEPDYENKMGRIVAFDDVPHLSQVKDNIVNFLKEYNIDVDLKVEGNHYYDINKCGIGYHGDKERKIVVGLRLGATIPIVYQWYYRRNPVGDRVLVNLNHGDIYIMSDKAVGNDWLRSIIYTLRHAAGCEEYIRVKEVIEIDLEEYVSSEYDKLTVKVLKAIIRKINEHTGSKIRVSGKKALLVERVSEYYSNR